VYHQLFVFKNNNAFFLVRHDATRSPFFFIDQQRTMPLETIVFNKYNLPFASTWYLPFEIFVVVIFTFVLYHQIPAFVSVRGGGFVGGI